MGMGCGTRFISKPLTEMKDLKNVLSEFKRSNDVLPIGFQSAELHSALVNLINDDGRGGKKKRFKPTTGLIALFTISSFCSSIHMYGFSGGSTLDKHKMSVNHNYAKEHAIYHALAQSGDKHSVRLFYEPAPNVIMSGTPWPDLDRTMR